MLNQTQTANKGDRNKIYFLIVVIVALLGTNAFLFFKNNHEKQRFVTTSTEKDRLRLEVEKIEVEFDKLNALNVALTEKLQQEQQQARAKIAALKQSLQRNEVTQADLAAAQAELNKLKTFLAAYTEDMGRLEKENNSLKSERDSLARSVESVSARARQLEKRNTELSEKVKSSAALKAFNVQLQAFKVKSSGKNVLVSKASAARKLITHFDIVPNPLAAKDYHKIYLRVFDPAGNLVADEKNMFEADGQEMQYSDMITISYNNDNTSYDIDWVNPRPFISGMYSVILYANGFTMGNASLDLR